MGIKKRQCFREQKEEMVQKILNDKSILKLGDIEQYISWTYQPLEETILRWRTKGYSPH